MPGSKKDKKNGKEGGGVAAAVTKNVGRFSYGKESPVGSSASPSPPAVQTPSSNGNPGASPLLSAISPTSFATTGTSPSRKEWARGLVPAAMAGSPGNLISLMGESPPTQPSSYEDSRAMQYGWSSPRPSNHYQLASASPPRPATRPLSFQMDGHYTPPDLHGNTIAAAPAAHRNSMHSYLAHARASPNPPLPHQPQAHFYGLPGIDFDPQPLSGMKAGERGYHFGFDTLPSPSADRLLGKDNVVLCGYEGGLEVHSVGKRGAEYVASLKGLRGGVYHAKILPWTSPGSDLFPLVAVVIHGPAVPLSSLGTANDGDYDAVSADRSDAITNTAPETGTKDGTGIKPSPGFIEAYQTSVEVYSLRTSELVEVLLEVPKIPLKTPITSPVFKAPSPTGALNIKADDGSILVSSGVTGECWLYRQMIFSRENRVQFVCLGKLWTTLQHPPKGDTAGEADRGLVRTQPRPRPQSAILSLRGRWLSYCPATPSSQIALRASVRVLASSKAPGLSSMTPPQLPPINSEVDLPISESAMNKIMRDATQELIQGAKWVGKQGWQAWNKYWNPPASQPSRSPPFGAQGWGGAFHQRQEPVQFPPTHGTVTPPAPKDPGLISILDIESLSTSPSLHPTSTFLAPYGCSFLSLAPSGLLLFTASSKGDVQTVWDLMRIQYTKASTLQSPPSSSANGGSRVRQVAQFSRMTVARIVDVAWTKPNGERAAMVTERGTVHLLDLPSGAFTWPPPRRRTRPQDDQSATAEGGHSAVSIASNALSSVRDVARPLMNRPRRSSSNVPQQTSPSLVDHASHGGKVIAASISHSLGKTGTAISQLRHTGENRVSLPASTISPGPSCVVWITTRKDHHLFVLGGGLVRTFPTKSRRMSLGGGARQRATRLTRYKDFRLPNLPDSVLAPSIKRYLDPEEYLDLTEKDLDAGNNTMVLDNRSRLQQAGDPSAESSIPQAEIESNAPYQPFHTDRRVALYEYCEDDGLGGDLPALSALFATASLEDKPTATGSRRKRQQQQQQQQQQHEQQKPRQEEAGSSSSHDVWVFGQPANAAKLDLGLPLTAEESFNIASDESRALPASAMERVLHHSGVNDDQIVVTTRRRRGAGRSADPDDDGFFEDDCEVLDFADQRV